MQTANGLGAAGSGFPVTVGQKTWTLSPLREKDRGVLEVWALRRAYRVLAELKDLLDPEDYRDQLRRLRDDAAAGAYDFDRPRVREALETYAGRVEVLRLMFSKHHPDMTAEAAETVLAAEPDQVRLAVEALHPELADGAEKKSPEAAPTPTTNPAPP